MAHAPLAVANVLIQKHPGQIDPMKLQKLLYFANGWWLAVKGQPLLSERPQVWRYGPVFKSIYRDFSRFGRSKIPEPERRSPFDHNPPFVEGPEAEEISQMLDWVWSGYGHRSGGELSDETHKPGTPWRKIAEREKYEVKPNTEIDPAEDWSYFAELARARGLDVRPLAA